MYRSICGGFKKQKMKTVHSKIPVSILLIALLAISNGCITYNTVEHAQGTASGSFFLPTESVDADGQPFQTDKPHPAYYALLPLTIPADIVTLPIQGVIMLCFVASGGKVTNKTSVNNSN